MATLWALWALTGGGISTTIMMIVWLQDPQADPHRRGLARAIGAEEAEDPTTGHAERELVERDGLPEPLRDAVDVEGHRRGG